MMSDSEKDNEFDTDSEEGDKGPKKKWGRNKDKGPADAPQAGDKEVRGSLSEQQVGTHHLHAACTAGIRPTGLVYPTWLTFVPGMTISVKINAYFNPMYFQYTMGAF